MSASDQYIVIRGASEHNLKHLNLEIPRNRLVVFTGVSGSGKSSLAFDTLYAEGQRRYVESLSAYARQFLGQMEKPKVDYIGGLSPAISIEQKSASRNPRSTVGTVTEIYDYLRVLYARAGIQHCHQCGREVGQQTPQQMVDFILTLPEGTRFQVLAPMILGRKGEHKDILEMARRNGFTRVRVNGSMVDLSEKIELDKKRKHSIEIVVDRLVVREGIHLRLTDSVETALKTSEGSLIVNIVDGEDLFFSEKLACTHCNLSFDELSPQRFSFNSPLGMCQACGGLGSTMQVDQDLVVPNRHLTLRQGAVAYWGEIKTKGSWTHKNVMEVCRQFDINVDTPWLDLPEEHRNILLFGSPKKIKFVWEFESGSANFEKAFKGVLGEIGRLHRQTHSERSRQYYERFMAQLPCETCEGAKLRPESLAVRIGGKSILDVVRMSVGECLDFYGQITLTAQQATIAQEVLKEIRARLRFMMNVGLHYLTLDRSAPTLSGGEAQRIRLASQIGSGLVGVMYILDEPSIGLHQRDNAKLLSTLIDLRDLGNTVIVVEHDEETMEAADWIIDFGPGAGHKGGEAVAEGPPETILRHPNSLTGQFLSGVRKIPVPKRRRPFDHGWLTVKGARHNNLREVDASFPLGCFTCVTGVSGSGKSSLVNHILFPALSRKLMGSMAIPGKHDGIEGWDLVDKIIDIDQKPIGRTPRSNPATYTKVFDQIRDLFSRTPEAKMRGYDAGRFSFNVKGGRCETCQGAGVKQIEMHFLADVFVVCEQCKGRRFNRETLEIRYKGRNIHEVLEMDVAEGLELFEPIPAIRRILETLHDVGLDYIKLGQPATTLSGGEAQRLKLSRELCKRDTGRTVYILDEPTTGLHFADIEKLLGVLNRLVDAGNTVIVIEHNLDVIKSADYIVDLGPEGGDGGGLVIATGSPEEVAKNKNSFTGQFLKKVVGRGR